MHRQVAACKCADMAEPLIILIVGVPGAGKTTVARALAQHFDRAALVEGDLVQHHFTVSGLVSPAEPSPESDRQLELRWKNCADLARNFHRFGFTAVVEHAVSRRRWVDQFFAETDPLPLSLVVLAPAAGIALARDQARADKRVGHLFMHMDAQLRDELSEVGWWLDTSTLTVDETVRAILDTGLDQGRLR